MAKITLKGNPVETSGHLPEVGTQAPPFHLTRTDLSEFTLADLKGKRVVFNIFPSADTSVCALSIRTFNQRAAGLANTLVLAVSKDLPFAHGRFCAAEGIDNVIPLSAFRSPDFDERYGVLMIDGPLRGLLARAVLVVDESGQVVYHELVPEITQEPDYDAALAAIK